MVNSILRYFDLQSKVRTAAAVGNDNAGPTFPVLPQYFAVAAGVIVEPFLRTYIQTGIWPIDLSTIVGRVVFGLIMGLILLPSVYKASFDPAKSIWVQVLALLPLGIGWQSLFSSVTKLVAP